MNVSAIPRDTLLGRLLRLPLRFLPPDLVVPILQGRLRGKRWVVGSGVHGYWVGCYEWEKQRAFERLVGKGSVVFDIGANVGFYSLLASELAGPTGRVFAFEPAPLNLHYLKRHLTLNRVSNVTVVEAAVWDRGGRVRFQPGKDSSQGHVDTDGFEVASVSLDDLWQGGTLPEPDVVKIDIEGGELRALQGAARLLTDGSPGVLLATHSGELQAACLEHLHSLGFTVEPLRNGSRPILDDFIAAKVS
jgi:FkbM family methyltransferase